MEEQRKIDRGIAIEKVWEDLDYWFEDQIDAHKDTLAHRDFKDMSNVKQLQGRIQALADLKYKLESWIKTKDKLLQQRRDNN